MTSRNSLWNSFREDTKRRTWCIAIIVLYYFLYFCVALPLTIHVSIINSAGSEGIVTQEVIELFSEYVGFNVFSAMMATVFAIISAIQGFSYLYDRKKVDFYISQPISKERAFIVRYINGILINFIPYIVFLCIGYVVGFVTDTISINALILGVKGIALAFAYYLAIYSITLIAVMMTGGIAVSLLATGVFLSYEFLLRVALNNLGFMSFWTYYNDYWDSISNTFTCPIYTLYMHYINDLGMTNIMPSFIRLMLMAIIFTLITYNLYIRRPNESSNRALSFVKSGVIINVLLSMMSGIWIGIVFYQVSEKSILFTVIGILLGILIVGAIVNVILDYDIAAIFRRKKSYVVAIVLTFGIFAIYGLDIMGYDSRIPNQGEIDSIAVSPLTGYNPSSYYNYDTGRYTPVLDYIEENMFIDDPGMINSITDNVSNYVANIKHRKMFNKEYQSERQEAITIIYRTNSTTAYRTYYLNLEYIKPMVATLMTSEEYHKGYNPLWRDYEVNVRTDVGATDRWGEQMILSFNDKDERYTKLKETLKAEILKYGIKLDGSIPVTVLYTNETFSAYDSSYNATYTVYNNIPIWDNYVETVAMLKELGYTPLSNEEMVDCIESIELYNYDLEDGYKQYSDAESINALSKVMITDVMARFVLGEYIDCGGKIMIKSGDNIDTDVERYREDTKYNYYKVLKANAPEFIYKDLNIVKK